MKLTLPVLILLALAFVPACSGSALEPPGVGSSGDGKIPSLTIAVPVGYRAAISSISGIKLQILEYDENDLTPDAETGGETQGAGPSRFPLPTSRFLLFSDFSGIDLLASFGDTVPEGFVFAGRWLSERPALSFRNDLGASYLDDSSATLFNTIEYLRGVIAEDGLPRLAADDGFFRKFGAWPETDSALREIDLITQELRTDSPLQTLLRGDAEAALLDGASQARLTLVPGRMKDRISSVYLSRQGRTLRLLTRKGNAGAAAVADSLIRAAGDLRSLGFLSCE